VAKSHARIEVYGTIDELNSVLGICISTVATSEIQSLLLKIQPQLFAIGGIVANPKQSAQLAEDQQAIEKLKSKVRITETDITLLEKAIDHYEQKLPPLKSFILPGGSVGAGYLHLARTVCRRAERGMVELSLHEPLPELFIVYMNRLSDLLFVLARSENAFQKIEDILW
jgi:cob(I)alamin adenosyltransferase